MISRDIENTAKLGLPRSRGHPPPVQGEFSNASSPRFG